MTMGERELPKSLYVSPEVHYNASIAAATLKMKLKDMTEEAIADFITKHNITIPSRTNDLMPVTK